MKCTRKISVQLDVLLFWEVARVVKNTWKMWMTWRMENICYAGYLDEKTNLTDFLPLPLVSNNTFHPQNITE